MKTGIYCILNIKNCKSYIGSTSIYFNQRWGSHRHELRYNKHKNIHLQRSWNKHGEAAFEFFILEYVKPEDCIKREQFYLDNYKPEYNISRTAGSGLGLVWTEESRKRLSIALKGKPAWNKGKKFSAESRAKMSKNMKGRIPPNKGKKGMNNKPVLRDDGKVYKNPYIAASELNVKPNTIVKAITDKNKVRKVKGFIFKYL